MIVLAMALAASGTLPVQSQLDQIDRTFICPEDLPTDEAREAALLVFNAQVQAVQPGLTLRQLIEYRYSMLAKHQCTKTLEAMRGR